MPVIWSTQLDSQASIMVVALEHRHCQGSPSNPVHAPQAQLTKDLRSLPLPHYKKKKTLGKSNIEWVLNDIR